MFIFDHDYWRCLAGSSSYCLHTKYYFLLEPFFFILLKANSSSLCAEKHSICLGNFRMSLLTLGSNHMPGKKPFAWIFRLCVETENHNIGKLCYGFYFIFFFFKGTHKMAEFSANWYYPQVVREGIASHDMLSRT